jgi:hypothetical protein
MFNFLNAQREENLANQHSSSSSSSSSSPLSPPRPTASQKQTPAQTQDQLRDPSQLVTQLSALLAKKNKTNQKATLKSVQRRVDRRDGPSGICKKTGQLFAAIIEQLNARLAEETGFQNMVTIEGVLGHMLDGARLLQDVDKNAHTSIMAAGAAEMVASAKRETKGTLIGILAQPTSSGQLSTAAMSEITGMSKRHVQQNRKKVNDGDLGVLGSLNKPPNGTRQTCPESETVHLPHVCISLRVS